MHKDLFILVKRVSDRVSLAAPTRRAFECESRSVSFNYSVVFCLFCFLFFCRRRGVELLIGSRPHVTRSNF